MSNDAFDQICILVPAFNEQVRIKKVVNKLKKHFKNILVVDDGSNDMTKEICMNLQIDLISHPFNLGTGAAFQTGVKYVRKYLSNCKYIITFDADDQHEIKDAINFASSIQNSDVEIIFGSRFIRNTSSLPFIKRIILRLAAKVTYYFYGIKLSDAHMGLKAFKKSAFDKIEISYNSYSYESELIYQVAQKKIKFKEMPATAYYEYYSGYSGQSILNGLRIFEDMIKILLKIK